MFRRKASVLCFCIAVLAVISCCGSRTAQADSGGEPYEVRTDLKEYTAYDPYTKKGAYGRYTELSVEGQAPDTLVSAAEKYNRSAEEAVKARVDASVRIRAAQAISRKSLLDAGLADDEYITIGYIVNVTRADDTAFSFLVTEYEKGPGNSSSDIVYTFTGSTFDTESGEEILLSDLAGDEETCSENLKKAVSAKYGLADFAETDPSDYAWTADAVGIRFYFNSDTVSRDDRWDIGDYEMRVITTAFPYSDLPGAAAEDLADVPESYIAMLERDILYDLPCGDMSILLTGTDDSESVLRILHDDGKADNLIIEHGDKLSDFYIIRAEGGFYLFRERSRYQEGFFYDFSRPDGGYGRFAYNTCQYFDSYLREIGLAVPYNPHCAHMAEVRRSFGEKSYGSGSFVPHGYYSFPSDPDTRYKIFVLSDDSLRIDAGNTACRLLADISATQIDEEGNELGEITVPAGKYLFFETVTGTASRYNIPPRRSERGTYFYECRVSDGTRIRFESTVESSVKTGMGFMNRFTEPVPLARAMSDDGSGETPSVETFYVRIGGKDYPLIADYSLPSHMGEQIDFGGDIWWQAEGYPGTYVLTDEDREEMQDAWLTPGSVSDPEIGASLVISDDGQAVLDCFGEVFYGTLPEKRYYQTDVSIAMESDTEGRFFQIRLREGEDHSVPEKIECFAEGEPATNEPSTVEPLLVYLTREE